MGLGEVKRREVLKSSYGSGQTTKEGVHFLGEGQVDPSKHHVACKKYQGLFPNTFYGLEAYGTH